MSKNKVLKKKQSWESFSRKELIDLVYNWVKEKKPENIFPKPKPIVKPSTKEIVDDLIYKVKSLNYKIVSSCYGNLEHLLLTWPKEEPDKLLQIKHKDRLKDLLFSLSSEIKEKLKVTILVFNTDNIPIINNWKKRKYFEKIEFQDPILVQKNPIKNLIKPDLEYYSNLTSLFLKDYSGLLTPGFPPADFIETMNNVMGEVITLFMEDPLTTWIQDPMIILNTTRESQPKILIEPDEDVLSNSRDVALIADKLKPKMQGIDLYQGFGWQIEGGNLLAGDNYVLIGADQITDSFEERQKIAKLLGLTSQRNIHVIKSRPLTLTNKDLNCGDKIFGKRQPFFHIDLFISLAGKSTSGKERVLVGYPVPLHKKHVKFITELRNRIQEVVEGLYNKGFEVIRNPIPFTYIDIKDEKDNNKKQRFWFFAFYNNCLVEITKDKHKPLSQKVWLPQYGLEESQKRLSRFDDENEQIWTDLGFKVFNTGDYGLAATLCGGLHCSFKTLERETFSY